MASIGRVDGRTTRIGDIYYADLTGIGSEQTGRRPCLVMQNNKGNKYSPNLIVLPITSSLKRLDMPTHVLLRRIDTGLRLDSMVLCENPVSISKERLGEYVTTLSKSYMARVARAHLIATSAIAFVELESLPEIWVEAARMNAA